MQIHGACHCGGIAFEAEVDPEQTAVCHCTDCQTLSGTAFRVVVPTSAERFRLLRGEPRLYVKTAESGSRRAMAFCPECGTQLWGCNEGDDPGRISVRVGALRERDELAPRRQLWCRSARSWVPGIADLPRLERQG